MAAKVYEAFWLPIVEDWARALGGDNPEAIAQQIFVEFCDVPTGIDSAQQMVARVRDLCERGHYQARVEDGATGTGATP